MDYSHYYHSRIKKSLDEDRAAINAGFQEIVKRGLHPRLRLVNYYKGLHISYPASIVDHGGGILELDVHQQQAVVLDRTRYAFLKCDFFDCSLLAQVHQVDVRRMSASLRNFSFVEIMAERRELLRLELDQPTRAQISAPEGRLSGELLDMSLGGFSIRTEERCPFPKSTAVRLKVLIPDLILSTVTSLETEAFSVETLRERDGDICRFCFEPDQQSEAAISRFVFQRQVEIIREIKEASS